MSPLEFRLLHYLYQLQGRPINRSVLLEHVWRYNYHDGSNVVDSAIKTLRRKLGDHASKIEAVRGIGYRLGLS